MKIGIYSNNVQVSTMLVSMAAQNGCKFTKVFRYNKTLLKGNDMVIIDLDNCSDGITMLEKDIISMPEILFVGISKSDDLLDKFRGILNAEKKPFKTELFLMYKKEITKRVSSEHLINKEDNRLYDELGINLAVDFNNADISVEKRLDILKDKIRSSSCTVESEDKFIKNIGLDTITIEKPVLVETRVVSIKEIIQDDAIIKYRIRKLKSMNLSNQDIDDRISAMLNHNQVISTSSNKSRINDSEKDILDKLRSGYFNNKRKTFEERKAEKEIEDKVISKLHQDTKEHQAIPTNLPPLKKPIQEIQEDVKKEIPNIFKKPNIQLDADSKKEEQIIGKEEPSEKKTSNQIPLKKPFVAINDTPSMPEAKKPMIGVGNIDTSINPFKKPIVIIDDEDNQKKEMDDPLNKLRERKRLIDIDNADDKTIITNNQDEKNIKDSSGEFEKKSLMDALKDKIRLGNKSQSTAEEELLQMADKKLKPPR